MSHGLSTNLAGLDGITNESYCKQVKVLVSQGRVKVGEEAALPPWNVILRGL